MKKKELSQHIDNVGEALGHMRAKARKNSPITQDEADALRCGAAMGIAYAIMASELPAATDSPELDAISIMERAIGELKEWKNG